MGCLNTIFKIWPDERFGQEEKNIGVKGREVSFRIKQVISWLLSGDVAPTKISQLPLKNGSSNQRELFLLYAYIRFMPFSKVHTPLNVCQICK